MLNEPNVTLSSRPGPGETAGDPGVAQHAGPEADPSDVESLDAIIAAVYDAISGPQGEERDWNRFRSLFAPGARLIPVGRQAQDAPFQAFVWTVDEYIERAGAQLMASGFCEDEIGRTVETYGQAIALDPDNEEASRGLVKTQKLRRSGRKKKTTKRRKKKEL